MIQRAILPRILRSLRHFPVVSLLGSRQTGKTTLAKEIQRRSREDAIYLDLELPSDLNKLQSPELYFHHNRKKLIIIDEIQRMPELFPILRALIDQQKRSGQFLLLGSSSPHLVKRASESLAGRIMYHELSPLNLHEVGHEEKTIKKLWFRGGYPKSFLAKNHQISNEWREAFLRTHVERDLPQLGIHISSVILRRFLSMAAHYHGQLLNQSALSKSLGISAPTVKHYTDIFENTFLMRQLQPYHANLKKRLVKSPKVYIRDSGLLHTLLGITAMEQLQSHPAIGFSWEGFIIEQIISMLPNGIPYYFFRTQTGAEIDLVLLKNRKAPLAIEIKYSLSPAISKGFQTAFHDLKSPKGFIVYPGQERYPLQKNIDALPVAKLKSILQEL